mmetsp:Transcript_32751/g.75367  ORF Transcript_32751/g.75367 Transcript_32751/m.75367 type:complete len:446 (-) Transcript_32751:1103-2440(-)
MSPSPENELAVSNPPSQSDDNYNSSAEKDEPLLFTRYPQPPREKSNISEMLEEYPEEDTTLRRICRENVWPGLGLFAGDFLLFSVIHLNALWEEAYPECFGYYAQCSRALVRSISYTSIWGLMCGMIGIGTLASFKGRRYGSLLTAAIMCIGGACIAITSLIPDQEVIFTSMAIFLFVFGVGLGGEYPLSAASATEKAMVDMYEKQVQVDREVAEQRRAELDNAADKAESGTEKCSDSEPASASEAENPAATTTEKAQPSSPTSVGSGENFDEDEAFIIEQERGQRVLGVFTMQGIGIFLSAFVLLVLLIVFGQIGGSDENRASDYNEMSLEIIWRVIVFAGVGFLLLTLNSRYEYLEESEVWASDAKSRRRRALLNTEDIAAAFSYEKAKDGTEVKDATMKRSDSMASDTSDNSEVLDMKLKDHSADRVASSKFLYYLRHFVQF